MDYKGREPPQLHVASLGVARGVQYSPHLTRCGIALRLFRVRLHLARGTIVQTFYQQNRKNI